jgi:penicillin-binding protein 1A
MEWVKKSARWETYKEAGMSDEQALAEFEKPVTMTVFSWKKSGPATDTTLTMTPLDSVRYYFCMLNCSFMAMDHRNGYVRAWVGGINFKHFKLDHIKTSRQVGSTFKPIVYAAALQDSIRPCDYFSNEIKKIVDWEPHNADERYGGFYSMSGALTRSVNVVAAQLIERVGIGHTIDLATKMGVTSKMPREYGISLGAADISLYEMMKVYGTIANKGTRPEPVTVLKVVNRDGEVIYDYKKELAANPKLGPNVQALNPYHAAVMTRMLQNVIDHGTGARLRYGYGIRGDFAGKTGTTQNQADGWFVCFNPQLVTGAWVGAESPAVRFRSMSLGQGSAMALPIVAWFWHKVANDKKLGRLLTERFPEPKYDTWSAMSCHSWLSIPPDSFNLLINNIQDTVLRDSLVAMYTVPPSDKKTDKPATPPGGEGGADDPQPPPANTKEEEKKGIFKRLFGHKPNEEEKDKKKQEKKDEKRNQ